VLALIQRVKQARVEVASQVIGAIDQGLLVLVCAEPADTDTIADKLVAKLLKLRIFSDEAGKMNRSVVDVQGGLLIVSQFSTNAC
jgi:D-tyrosyl-tRNA(Tyr) deacylase